MVEAKSTMKNCEQCLRHDGESTRAPLVPIEATGPMDLLHLDFTKIEISGDREKELKKPRIVNVLMITDHFTHHTMAFMTEDTTAQTGTHFVPSLFLYFWYPAAPHDGQ